MTIKSKNEHSDSGINSEYIDQIKTIIKDISIKAQEIDISKNNLNYFLNLESFLFDSLNKIEYLYRQLLINNIKK
ncbi:MAG: hypothetical protein LBS60_03035 [Deltaproteobacteria bacterium]|jgi:hypothetical protein|nr:hypothetical protein [Deltaproteobacteria bacterium]